LILNHSITRDYDKALSQTRVSLISIYGAANLHTI